MESDRDGLSAHSTSIGSIARLQISNSWSHETLYKSSPRLNGDDLLSGLLRCVALNLMSILMLIPFMSSGCTRWSS
jgi:hypothetical protein